MKQDVTVKVYDKDRKYLFQSFTGVPDVPRVILELVAHSMITSGVPDQEFMIRVDGSATGGYWMNIKARGE